MTLHPREKRGLDRRQFLGRSAAAVLGASGAGSLLAACGGDEGPAAGEGTTGRTETAPFELARR
jgi:nitrous oxide reductase